MGNSKSKKVQKEPDRFFDREKWKETKRDEKRKKKMNPANKRLGVQEPVSVPGVPVAPPGAGPVPSPAAVRSYDNEALERMRYQLRNDSDAFLLNNILLSVQFFENFDLETRHIKENPISEREHRINEAMVKHHKHVFFADRLQECVHEHVRYARARGIARDQLEPLTAPRLFVIYDNVEACEPGDTSDYSAVLDAPFYKLQVEDCRESGYVKLKKLEVLESTLANKEDESTNGPNTISDDNIYTDSEKESFDSDDSTYATKGEALLQKLKTRLNEPRYREQSPKLHNMQFNDEPVDIVSGRRRSGPIKQFSSLVQKADLHNINNIRKLNSPLLEESERRATKENLLNINDSIETASMETDTKPRKSILKYNNTRRFSGPVREIKNKNHFQLRKISPDNSIAEDTETSGYRSNSSSRQTESSEAESDYGYTTITMSTTPKRIELSVNTNFSAGSGVLPEECWTQVQVRAVDNWSDDEDDEDVTASKESLTRTLYEEYCFLNSITFMTNFVDNFMVKLGTGLGLSKDTVSNAMTQGASIYCDAFKTSSQMSYEVIPALLAAWPNAANQWIIRERKIIKNPRTNFSYQWPTKYMVSKAIGFGCLFVPVGFRPKRGANSEQNLQWRIIFPAAERYLESCLAHSHIRTYLFTLALHKTFLESDTSKIGVTESHIKNHLLWQCEDNYAKWPEDRLGETLRLFLKSFYVHFGHAKFPNYFVESCNDFKSIPKPLLLKLQRRLADILEAPVLHVLSAVDKLKYIKKGFYPKFNAGRLYQILTSKNPLRILNPNLPPVVHNQAESSDSENERDADTSFWDRAKNQDKHYQWKKEKQKQMQERRKQALYAKKQKPAVSKTEIEINTQIQLPKQMEPERRRLILEFFIPHFIAMSRSSEKFEAIKQAVIYLEQAHRLCVLLSEEPAGDTSANDYFNVIRDKLADCQRKLVNQGGFKLPPRRESQVERVHFNRIRKQRPRYEQIVNQDSPTETTGAISAFTFVDVHMDQASPSNRRHESVSLSETQESDEESKL